ncbi:hypothetical protein BKA83DRAFT_4299401 [Pisolithus microcarpus]|nr:hypothetical protein BKA83DRAFT_4299401 [Pisolithus microcarpus]
MSRILYPTHVYSAHWCPLSPAACPRSSDSSQTAIQPRRWCNIHYKPALVKTFQCRGYGNCRMVFIRSEHRTIFVVPSL